MYRRLTGHSSNPHLSVPPHSHGQLSMSQPIRNIFGQFLPSYAITHPCCRHGYDVRRNMRSINLNGSTFLVRYPGSFNLTVLFPDSTQCSDNFLVQMSNSKKDQKLTS